MPKNECISVTAVLGSPSECYCGDSLPSKKASNCDMKCAGDDNKVCGGKDAISIYSGSCSPRNHDDDNPTSGSVKGATNIGCYKDDPSDSRRRVLPEAMTKSTKDMDAEVSALRNHESAHIGELDWWNFL